ncbi:MAG: hypothetical protein ACLTKI_07165 [Lachnospiraceae bacterium]
MKRQSRRKKNRIARRQLAVVGIAAVFMVVIAACILLFMNQAAKYRMPVTGYLYQYEDTYEIPAGETLWLDMEGGDARVGTKDSERVLGAVPIYMDQGEEQCLIPVATLYRNPRSLESGQLPPATVITKKNGPFTAENGRKQASLDRGFLFDGSNTYVFFEEMTISFNGREKTLSPFSYVRAVPGSRVELYDYGTGEFVTEEMTGDVLAVCGDYSLSLSGDTLTNRDGVRELLANRPSVLPSLMD